MKVLKSIFSKIFVLALILGVAISFAGCKKDTNKTQSNEKWFTPSKHYDPAKVLKGVTPLYTIKQQEQEAQEKEPTLLDKVYLSSAKQKQSIGADLNVPEIGVTMK